MNKASIGRQKLKSTVGCRGFGTVRFSTKEEAEAAADKLNNTQIGGRTVTVRIDRFA